MKLTPRSVFLLFAVSLAAVLARAQGSPQGTIKHVIIVIQENRTPDNLFYANAALWNNGGNVRPPGPVPSGDCRIPPNDNGQLYTIPLTTYRLDACFDTKHQHWDWTTSYRSGHMDGACLIHLKTVNCSGGVAPPCQVQLPDNRPCPAYSCVGYPTINVIDPYFRIANHYGFCNYCFQTNQGPSFPAHQFLFSGTSLPNAYPNSKFTWFAADNVFRDPNDPNQKVGCEGPDSELVPLIDDTGSWPLSCTPGQGTDHCVKPCLFHKTMLDVFHIPTPHITWKYYAHSRSDLWEAPSAVHDVCSPSGGSCQNQEYNDNVVFPDSNPPEHAKILKHIESCTLPQVSWVIPDGKWSDHPGRVGHDGGPSWVAHIVNAIGNSWEQSKVNGQNHQCDYWGNQTNDDKKQPTVILIVWDDWGGWYDHVSPDWPSGPGIGYAHDSSKSGWYVNGFRVPMLVVSAFNKHVTNGTDGFDGYVSGPRDNHTCQDTNYCHDFGSILNFVEFTFGSGGSYLGSIGDGHSDYADALAPDAPPTCLQTVCPYSLSDFFNFNQNATAFTAITGMKYAETCFHNPDQTGCWPGAGPADPDDDADEN
jgi:hypothetical protein